MSKTHEVLNKVFGFKEFRPLQEEIIDHVLDDKDALAILPTGGGKSLCFQIPALCLPGLTLVISPLIALMHDQVTALKGVGVAAACIHSNVSPDEKREIIESFSKAKQKDVILWKQYNCDLTEVKRRSVARTPPERNT